MFDYQTDSLWHNLTGEPVVGELAHSGIKLKVLPVVITTWEKWLSGHPDTVVLDIKTGFDRPYAPGQPYGKYFASPDTMFPVSPRSHQLKPKSYVFAVRLNNQPRAYPLVLQLRFREGCVLSIIAAVIHGGQGCWKRRSLSTGMGGLPG